MDDTISRQAAIATAISGRVRTLPTTEAGENWIRVNEVRDSLLSLPSAEYWTPIIDELPEIGDRVLVTIPSIGETFVTIGTYAGEHRWYVSDYGFCEKIIAWSPLPSPYKSEDKQ